MLFFYVLANGNELNFVVILIWMNLCGWYTLLDLKYEPEQNEKRKE